MCCLKLWLRLFRKQKFFVSRYPKWFSKELIENMKLKMNAANILWAFNCSHKESDRTEFRQLRAICIFQLRKCRRNYIREIQESLHTYVKKKIFFWNSLIAQSVISISLLPCFWGISLNTQSYLHLILTPFIILIFYL